MTWPLPSVVKVRLLVEPSDQVNPSGGVTVISSPTAGVVPSVVACSVGVIRLQASVANGPFVNVRVGVSEAAAAGAAVATMIAGTAQAAPASTVRRGGHVSRWLPRPHLPRR